jgi:TrmH family RNA methyltransferase
MEPIRSAHNPLVKYLLKLKKRKFREREGKFIIEGVRFVEEALAADWPVEMVLFPPGLLESPRGAGLAAAASAKNIKTVLIDEYLAGVLAFTETPQGVLALCGMPARRPGDMDWALPAPDPDRNTLLVVVDGISDPGNLGTIIRSADAFGADGVVLLKRTVDLYNSKTLRATMGSLFHLPVVSNAGTELLSGLSDRGIALLAPVPAGGVPAGRLDLKRPLALVVGSEASGPSREVLSLPHEKVTIPMPGRAESLNAGVAASILMYEVARQRSRPGS